jgi:hypothetical protein
MFCFRGRLKWNEGFEMSSLITVAELKAQPRAPEPGFEITVAREVRLARMLMAYITTGLLFMVLPGTFLGVWNLLTISSHRAAGTASVGWIRPTDVPRSSAG